MLMEYAITKLAAGKHHSIPLSNTQFDEIKRNRSVLSAAFNFETCFDLFLRTFSEFEGARLDAALNNALYRITEYRDLFHLKQNCAAKFLATLNACKVYLYQSQKALKR